MWWEEVGTHQAELVRGGRTGLVPQPGRVQSVQSSWGLDRSHSRGPSCLAACSKGTALIWRASTEQLQVPGRDLLSTGFPGPSGCRQLCSWEGEAQLDLCWAQLSRVP